LGLGRRVEAEAALPTAEAGAQAQGFRPLLWRILADLARAHQSRRLNEPAASALAAARNLVETLAAPLPEDRLRQRFVEQALASLPSVPAPAAQQALKRRFGGLTTREREVAARVAQGLSNREIGRTLVISQRTIEVHVANIMAKLGVDTRAQIAVWAAENGLLAGHGEK
jgi:DNA-binding NarL/FixJ family response regulator